MDDLKNATFEELGRWLDRENGLRKAEMKLGNQDGAAAADQRMDVIVEEVMRRRPKFRELLLTPRS